MSRSKNDARYNCVNGMNGNDDCGVKVAENVSLMTRDDSVSNDEQIGVKIEENHDDKMNGYISSADETHVLEIESMKHHNALDKLSRRIPSSLDLCYITPQLMGMVPPSAIYQENNESKTSFSTSDSSTAPQNLVTHKSENKNRSKGNDPAELASFLDNHHFRRYLLFNVSDEVIDEASLLLLRRQVVHLPWGTPSPKYVHTGKNKEFPEEGTAHTVSSGENIVDQTPASSIPIHSRDESIRSVGSGTLTSMSNYGSTSSQTPAVSQVLEICYAIHAYTSSSSLPKCKVKNEKQLQMKKTLPVACIFCSNGKTRTGVIVACYLRFTNQVADTLRGFELFCQRRGIITGLSPSIRKSKSSNKSVCVDRDMSGHIPPSLRLFFYNFDEIMNLKRYPHPEPLLLQSIQLRGVPVDDMPCIDIWEHGDVLRQQIYSSHDNSAQNEWSDDEGMYKIGKVLKRDFTLVCRFGGRYASEANDPTKVLFRYVNSIKFLRQGRLELNMGNVDMMRRYADSFDEEDFFLVLDFMSADGSEMNQELIDNGLRFHREKTPDTVLNGFDAILRGWLIISESHSSWILSDTKNSSSPFKLAFLDSRINLQRIALQLANDDEELAAFELQSGLLSPFVAATDENSALSLERKINESTEFLVRSISVLPDSCNLTNGCDRNSFQENISANNTKQKHQIEAISCADSSLYIQNADNKCDKSGMDIVSGCTSSTYNYSFSESIKSIDDQTFFTAKDDEMNESTSEREIQSMVHQNFDLVTCGLNERSTILETDYLDSTVISSKTKSESGNLLLSDHVVTTTNISLSLFEKNCYDIHQKTQPPYDDDGGESRAYFEEESRLSLLDHEVTKPIAHIRNDFSRSSSINEILETNSKFSSTLEINDKLNTEIQGQKSSGSHLPKTEGDSNLNVVIVKSTETLDCESFISDGALLIPDQSASSDLSLHKSRKETIIRIEEPPKPEDDASRNSNTQNLLSEELDSGSITSEGAVLMFNQNADLVTDGECYFNDDELPLSILSNNRSSDKVLLDGTNVLPEVICMERNQGNLSTQNSKIWADSCFFTTKAPESRIKAVSQDHSYEQRKYSSYFDSSDAKETKDVCIHEIDVETSKLLSSTNDSTTVCLDWYRSNHVSVECIVSETLLKDVNTISATHGNVLQGEAIIDDSSMSCHDSQKTALTIDNEFSIESRVNHDGGKIGIKNMTERNTDVEVTREPCLALDIDKITKNDVLRKELKIEVDIASVSFETQSSDEKNLIFDSFPYKNCEVYHEEKSTNQLNLSRSIVKSKNDSTNRIATKNDLNSDASDVGSKRTEIIDTVNLHNNVAQKDNELNAGDRLDANTQEITDSQSYDNTEPKLLRLEATEICDHQSQKEFHSSIDFDEKTAPSETSCNIDLSPSIEMKNDLSRISYRYNEGEFNKGDEYIYQKDVLIAMLKKRVPPAGITLDTQRSQLKTFEPSNSRCLKALKKPPLNDAKDTGNRTVTSQVLDEGSTISEESTDSSTKLKAMTKDRIALSNEEQATKLTLNGSTEIEACIVNDFLTKKQCDKLSKKPFNSMRRTKSDDFTCDKEEATHQKAALFAIPRTRTQLQANDPRLKSTKSIIKESFDETVDESCDVLDPKSKSDNLVTPMSKDSTRNNAENIVVQATVDHTNRTTVLAPQSVDKLVIVPKNSISPSADDQKCEVLLSERFDRCDKRKSKSKETVARSMTTACYWVDDQIDLTSDSKSYDDSLLVSFRCDDEEFRNGDDHKDPKVALRAMLKKRVSTADETLDAQRPQSNIIEPSNVRSLTAFKNVPLTDVKSNLNTAVIGQSYDEGDFISEGLDDDESALITMRSKRVQLLDKKQAGVGLSKNGYNEGEACIVDDSQVQRQYEPRSKDSSNDLLASQTHSDSLISDEKLTNPRTASVHESCYNLDPKFESGMILRSTTTKTHEIDLNPKSGPQFIEHHLLSPETFLSQPKDDQSCEHFQSEKNDNNESNKCHSSLAGIKTTESFKSDNRIDLTRGIKLYDDASVSFRCDEKEFRDGDQNIGTNIALISMLKRRVRPAGVNLNPQRSLSNTAEPSNDRFCNGFDKDPINNARTTENTTMICHSVDKNRFISEQTTDSRTVLMKMLKNRISLSDEDQAMEITQYSLSEIDFSLNNVQPSETQIDDQMCDEEPIDRTAALIPVSDKRASVEDDNPELESTQSVLVSAPSIEMTHNNSDNDNSVEVPKPRLVLDKMLQNRSISNNESNSGDMERSDADTSFTAKPEDTSQSIVETFVEQVPIDPRVSLMTMLRNRVPPVEMTSSVFHQSCVANHASSVLKEKSLSETNSRGDNRFLLEKHDKESSDPENALIVMLNKQTQSSTNGNFNIEGKDLGYADNSLTSLTPNSPLSHPETTNVEAPPDPRISLMTMLRKRDPALEIPTPESHESSGAYQDSLVLEQKSSTESESWRGKTKLKSEDSRTALMLMLNKRAQLSSNGGLKIEGKALSDAENSLDAETEDTLNTHVGTKVISHTNSETVVRQVPLDPKIALMAMLQKRAPSTPSESNQSSNALRKKSSTEPKVQNIDANADFSHPQFRDDSIPPNIKNDPRFEKYFRMLNMVRICVDGNLPKLAVKILTDVLQGLPLGAVKNAMLRDQHDPTIMDLDPDKPLENQRPSNSSDKEVPMGSVDHMTPSVRLDSETLDYDSKKDQNIKQEDDEVPLKLDPKYEKYFRMLKMGLPNGAVKNALQRDGLNPEILNLDPNKPLASQVEKYQDGDPPIIDDPIYQKYFKMLKMGLPMGAVKNALQREGLDPTIMDLDPTKSVSSQMSTNKKDNTDEPPLTEDPVYQKYFKMLKMGLPIGAVKNALQRDGLNPDVIDLDPNKSLASQQKQEEELMDNGPKLKDDPTYQKYFKMLKMGLPVGAVKNALVRDGLNPDIIDFDQEKSLEYQKAVALRKVAAEKPQKKESKKPNVRRKKIYWSPIEESRIEQNSLWSIIKGSLDFESLKVDQDEFESLFTDATNSAEEKRAINEKSTMSKQKKSVQVIDAKRGMNGGIILARDSGSLDDTQLKALLELLPTQEERLAIDQYIKNASSSEESKAAAINDFCACEKYMYAMKDIKIADKKFECMLFKYQFENKLNELMGGVSTLLNACEEVQKSVRLQKLMAMILMLGNQINTGGSGRMAHGFTLDALLKLDEAKAFDKKTSVLQYLVKLVKANEPDLLKVREEIPSIGPAEQVIVDSLISELKCLTERLNNVQETATAEGDLYRSGQVPLRNVTTLNRLRQQRTKIIDIVGVNMYNQTALADLTPMEKFVTYAEKRTKEALARTDLVQENFKGVLAYFGEDPAMTSADFFGTLNKFVGALDAALEVVTRLEAQQAAEEKKAAAHRAKEAAKKPKVLKSCDVVKSDQSEFAPQRGRLDLAGQRKQYSDPFAGPDVEVEAVLHSESRAQNIHSMDKTEFTTVTKRQSFDYKEDGVEGNGLISNKVDLFISYGGSIEESCAQNQSKLLFPLTTPEASKLATNRSDRYQKKTSSTARSLNEENLSSHNIIMEASNDSETSLAITTNIGTLNMLTKISSQLDDSQLLNKKTALTAMLKKRVTSNDKTIETEQSQSKTLESINDTHNKDKDKAQLSDDKPSDATVIEQIHKVTNISTESMHSRSALMAMLNKCNALSHEEPTELTHNASTRTDGCHSKKEKPYMSTSKDLINSALVNQAQMDKLISGESSSDTRTALIAMLKKRAPAQDVDPRL